MSEYEKAQETNIDKPAEQFGILLGEVAAMKDDEWSDELRVLGNNLGRFIYLLDAYDDLEKDEKKNNYNVFKYHKDVEDFDTFAENILKAYMAGVQGLLRDCRFLQCRTVKKYHIFRCMDKVLRRQKEEK